MDSAQKVFMLYILLSHCKVSILVIMDSAQKDHSFITQSTRQCVSILVIMDSAQKGKDGKIMVKYTESFNPCYNG